MSFGDCTNEFSISTCTHTPKYTIHICSRTWSRKITMRVFLFVNVRACVCVYATLYCHFACECVTFVTMHQCRAQVLHFYFENICNIWILLFCAATAAANVGLFLCLLRVKLSRSSTRILTNTNEAKKSRGTLFGFCSTVCAISYVCFLYFMYDSLIESFKDINKIFLQVNFAVYPNTRLDDVDSDLFVLKYRTYVHTEMESTEQK